MIIGSPDYSDYLSSLRDSVEFLTHRERTSYDFDLYKLAGYLESVIYGLETRLAQDSAALAPADRGRASLAG